MMSDRFTKGKISLVLTVVHMCLIHPLTAQIFVYLLMYGISYCPAFLVNVRLEIYLWGEISMYVSYMLCFEKEDFIWLYFDQNACAKSQLQANQGQSYSD